MLNLTRYTHPSPVAFRREDGVFVAHNGEAWLYRVLPLVPLYWEDQDVRDEEANRMHHLLTELTQLGKGSPVPGSRIGADYREFHLLRLVWDTVPTPPQDGPLGDWQRPVLSRFSVTDGLLALGVRLRRQHLTGERRGGVWSKVTGLFSTVVDGEPDPASWAADQSGVAAPIARAGGMVPTDEQADRLEFWWNGGRGADAPLYPSVDGMSVATQMWPSGLQMTALIGSDVVHFDPDDGMWMQEALTHDDGCVAVSVRGQLVHAGNARAMLRRSQRKAINQITEQAETGDLDREEDTERLLLAQQMESATRAGEVLLRDTSIVFARRAEDVNTTFADMLNNRWGFRIRVVQQRQLEALEETLPCGATRLGNAKPFAQDVTAGVIAASGFRAFSTVGDKTGLWMGCAMHDMTPVWLDPLGSARADKPPTMAVVGEPGSGKTFLLQLLSTQAAVAGLPVVFVNPKPADDLSGFALTVGGEVVTVSSLAEEPGLLDPFRFARPTDAAQIALAHILTVFVEMREEDEIKLSAGLTRAATAGARSVGEALTDDLVPEEVRNLVMQQAEGAPLFAMGVGDNSSDAHGSLGGDTGGLTLVQFDRQLDLPSQVAPVKEYNRNERIAVAAVRLVARAALEQMFQHGGGVLVLDEAHVFLSSQEGRAILQRLGREGRSQRILPILATQRIADLVANEADMGSYLGRTMVMRMTDEREASAALNVCGLDATPERLSKLGEAGPDREAGLPAWGLLRGLNGRCAAVSVGPIPEDMRLKWSTNADDRRQVAAATA